MQIPTFGAQSGILLLYILGLNRLPLPVKSPMIVNEGMPNGLEQ